MLNDNGKALLLAIAVIIAGVTAAICVQEVAGVLMAAVGFADIVAIIIDEIKECKIPYGKKGKESKMK